MNEQGHRPANLHDLSVSSKDESAASECGAKDVFLPGTDELRTSVAASKSHTPLGVRLLQVRLRTGLPPISVLRAADWRP